MNHGPGLTFRFLAAQVLVVVISLLVAAAVATTVGPTLFHDHMLMTGQEDPSLELFHAEQAYRGANLITLAVALPTALISALLASLWLSRRLRTPPAGSHPRRYQPDGRQLPYPRARRKSRPRGHHPGACLQHHGRPVGTHRTGPPPDAL